MVTWLFSRQEEESKNSKRKVMDVGKLMKDRNFLKGGDSNAELPIFAMLLSRHMTLSYQWLLLPCL